MTLYEVAMVVRMKEAPVQGSRKCRAGWKRGLERVKKREERSWRRTRRISPLQRILSALHLFQDAVFSLCVEKNPTPSSLENVVLSFFLPFPFCPVFTPPSPEAATSLLLLSVFRRCPPLSFRPFCHIASRKDSHLPVRFKDSKPRNLPYHNSRI